LLKQEVGGVNSFWAVAQTDFMIRQAYPELPFSFDKLPGLIRPGTGRISGGRRAQHYWLSMEALDKIRLVY
jgi:hypothetical protein